MKPADRPIIDQARHIPSSRLSPRRFIEGERQIHLGLPDRYASESRRDNRDSCTDAASIVGVNAKRTGEAIGQLLNETRKPNVRGGAIKKEAGPGVVPDMPLV